MKSAYGSDNEEDVSRFKVTSTLVDKEEGVDATMPRTKSRSFRTLIAAALAVTLAVGGAIAYLAQPQTVAPVPEVKPMTLESQQTTPTPRKKLPVCLFLHGAMVKGARPTVWKTSYGEVTGSLRTYWGPYNVWYADLCESFVYSFAETENYNWLDKHLQDSYVGKAQEVINRGGVVFAHSMANAILAGACYKQNKCVQWYSLGGGYSGQAIGNAMLTILNAVPALGAFMNDIVYRGFDMKGDAMRITSNGNANAMAKVVDSKRLLKGSVCGIKPGGNPRRVVDSSLEGNPFKLFDFPTAVRVENEIDQFGMGVAMAAGGGLVAGSLLNNGHIDVRNDGLVEVEACAFYRNGGRTADQIWYGGKGAWPELGPSDMPTRNQTHILAQINHIEECGVFPNTPVVMNWMRNMMCNELESDGVSKCPPQTIPYEWPTPSGKIGEACDLFHKCEGDMLIGAGNFCCSNKGHSICQKKLMDFKGNYWCPNDCQGSWNKPGTCENGDRLHWPRWQGEPCTFESDCEGWFANRIGCCTGFCTPKKKDWAGLWWCPQDCVGRFLGQRGTC